MREKLLRISGSIAAAAFAAKEFNGDEAMSKMLLDVVQDLNQLINEL